MAFFSHFFFHLLTCSRRYFVCRATSKHIFFALILIKKNIENGIVVQVQNTCNSLGCEYNNCLYWKVFKQCQCIVSIRTMVLGRTAFLRERERERNLQKISFTDYEWWWRMRQKNIADIYIDCFRFWMNVWTLRLVTCVQCVLRWRKWCIMWNYQRYLSVKLEKYHTHIHILIYMRQKNTDQRYKNLEKKQYQEQLMHININRRMFNWFSRNSN